MTLSSITPETTRAALRAIRYGKPLGRSPLLQLAAVTLELRREGMPDTRHTREWALAALIGRVVDRECEALRPPAPRAAERAGKSDLVQLQADFRLAVPDLEAWSALHARYLSAAAPAMADLTAALGVHERTLERRVTRGHELLAAALAELEATAQRDTDQYPGAPPQARVVVARSVPVADPAFAARHLLEAVTDDRTVVHLNGHTADAIAQMPAPDLQAYRLGRIAEWSQPRYRLDRRFVQLTLLVDKGEAAALRWLADDRFDDLRSALDAVPDRTLVLLGPPGAGKSTLLRRLEMDLSIDWLRSGSDRVTFFVPLNRYRAERPGGKPPSPGAWLSDRWHARWPDLPPLEELVDAGRAVLLLDALNEMPHRGFAEYHDLVMAWKSHLHSVLEDHPSNQVVFSCRSLDYSAPLSSSQLRVPQVRIEPMTDDAVHRFLTIYSPTVGEGIWQVIDGTSQLDLVRVPYFCRLLVEQVESDDRIPAGRAALFTGFVRNALRRELERDNPLFVPGPLLSERDARRVLNPRAWRTDWDLPTDGPLMESLQRLAFGMQHGLHGEEEAQVRVPLDQARSMIGTADSLQPELVLHAGVDLALLDEDPSSAETMFFHQLLQEYFAARELAARPDPELARTPWRDADVAPPLALTLAELDASSPLPSLPASGWEETAVLAAVMSANADTFVSGLAGVNLPLAGRAASEPDTHGRLSPATLTALRAELATRAEDPAADLRARLDAAWQLGRLGDVRLSGITSKSGADVRLGPFVRIGALSIARYPVTNAAWALFLAAGAYEDIRWWPQGAASDWRAGKGTAHGSRDDYRMWRHRLLESPTLLDEHYRDGRIHEPFYGEWKRRMRMSDSEFEAHLAEKWPDGPKRLPEKWLDPDFSNPSQPVVGVSWYEANAFCLWLSAETDTEYRLPTSDEWSAAARGEPGRDYAWGDVFDPLRCNSIASHLKRPSPVGVFVDGNTPEGVADMTGNVFEWTSTVAAGEPGPQVVIRGGAWASATEQLTAGLAPSVTPDRRSTDCGFRLAAVPARR